MEYKKINEVQIFILLFVVLFIMTFLYGYDPDKDNLKEISYVSALSAISVRLIFFAMKSEK